MITYPWLLNWLSENTYYGWDNVSECEDGIVDLAGCWNLVDLVDAINAKNEEDRIVIQ